MFLFRLAVMAGEVDVDAMARRIPGRLLKEWMAFWRLEPFGDPWRMAGRMAAVMAKAAGGQVPDDFEDKFLPSYREKPQTEDEMIAILRTIPAFARQFDQQKGGD